LQEYEGAFTLSLLEDSHLSALLDSTDPSNCEAVVLIQVYVLLSIYFFYKHRWTQGAEYAGKAINIVNDFGMRISPPKSSKSDLVFIQTGASLGGWESCTIVQGTITFEYNINSYADVSECRTDKCTFTASVRRNRYMSAYAPPGVTVML
jgi:hypothetical protein